MRRPCLDCPALALPNRSRCKQCEARKQHARYASRVHYHGDYQARAAHVRANATTCWLCGKGPIEGDPWQADHVTPGNPNSELRAAHRSCNASRGNRTPPNPD